jgi:D-amino-acid dehydrogenase
VHDTYDAIVVGGGLVGAATAYHLVRAGARTLLVDRADRGRATDAGAGILSPETSARGVARCFEFARRAFQFYPMLLEHLQADGVGETGYARCGLLLVASAEEECEAYEVARENIFSRRRSSSLDELREVSGDEARRMFPALGRVFGALYHRNGARVDGRLLLRAVLAAAERRGLTIAGDSVEALEVHGGRVAGVRAGRAAFAAPRVAITGGAWSAALGDPLGVRIPVAPQRGQIVHLRMPDVETSTWPIVEGFRGHYLVPWPDHRVAAGATRETGSGFDPRLTTVGVHEVLDEALRVAPGLADWEIHEMRVGLRPLSGDGLPVLGEVPGVDGAYVATGHGPSGLQLGPYSGRLVADLMLGRAPEIDLFPFRVTRFTEQGSDAAAR